MGIDYDSKLIYGWSIDTTQNITDLLVKNEVGTCSGTYKKQLDGSVKLNGFQCFCYNCWDHEKLENIIPKDSEGNFIAYIISNSPYYDCPNEDRECHISLTNKECLTLEDIQMVSKNIPLVQKIVEEINNTEQEEPEEPVIESGPEGQGPKIYSVIDIT